MGGKDACCPPLGLALGQIMCGAEIFRQQLLLKCPHITVWDSSISIAGMGSFSIGSTSTDLLFPSGHLKHYTVKKKKKKKERKKRGSALI